MANDKKRVSDQYPELFHYTQVCTFKKIYTSRKFWATHYQDLNDSSELHRFRLKVSEFIAPHVRKIFENRMRCNAHFSEEVGRDGGIDAVVEEEAVEQVEVLHRATFGERAFQETFICSFCAHDVQSYEAKHGLLSQWRGYGSGGIAIVLDTKGIEDGMKREKDVFAHPINHIGDVKYDDDDVVEIQNAFFKVFEHLPGILAAFYSGKDPRYEEIFDHFVHGSTLVKHHGFYEEKEVRIVVSPRPTNPAAIFYDCAHDSRPIKVICFRRRGESESRYIELFGDAALPIKRVIVGPSRTQNLNYQTIRDLVTDPSIDIIKSKTPFLG